MPYKSLKSLPDKVSKALPVAAQKVWKSAFNSAHGEGKSEKASAQIAWGAVKNAGYEKVQGFGLYQLRKSVKRKVGGDSLNCKVLKSDTKLNIVFGWGMVSKLNMSLLEKSAVKAYYDSDNQMIPEQVMLSGVSKYMSQPDRINNHEHTEAVVGEVIHSFPMTEEIAKSLGIDTPIYGWLVGVQTDDESIQKFASGDYNGFSIEGLAQWMDDEEG